MKKILALRPRYQSVSTLIIVYLLFIKPVFCQTKPDPNSIKISSPGTSVTLVNVIKVEPTNYAQLLTLLREGTDNLFSQQKGFRGVVIQSNNEKNTVILYGQWDKKEDIENFRKVAEIQTYFKSLLQLGTFESFICENIPYLKSKL